MRAASVALVALLLSGPPPAAGACKGTLTGAVTGAFDCAASLSSTPGGEALFAIEPRAPIPGVPSYVPGAFLIPEPVEARRYTLDELGQGRASVAAEGGTLYTATKTSSQRGEVVLTFTRVRANPRVPGGRSVNGSYRARLVPAGGGKSGEVVIEVRF